MDGVKYETPAHLKVVCRKCTRQVRVRGISEEQADRIAKALGWRDDGRGLVCPECPGGGRIDILTLRAEKAAMQGATQPA